MFLVPAFCVILKNSPYILINVFKIPTFFSVSTIGPCRLFSMTRLTEDAT